MFNDERFMTQLAKFHAAAAELNKIWEEEDHTGDYWVTAYPFDHSFNEVVSEIGHWLKIQEAASKRKLKK